MSPRAHEAKPGPRRNRSARSGVPVPRTYCLEFALPGCDERHPPEAVAPILYYTHIKSAILSRLSGVQQVGTLRLECRDESQHRLSDAHRDALHQGLGEYAECYLQDPQAGVNPVALIGTRVHPEHGHFEVQASFHPQRPGPEAVGQRADRTSGQSTLASSAKTGHGGSAEGSKAGERAQPVTEGPHEDTDGQQPGWAEREDARRYDSLRQAMLAERSAFGEKVRQYKPLLEAQVTMRFGRGPHRTPAEKTGIADWINGELATLGLTLVDQQGKPASLKVEEDNEHAQGVFRLIPQGATHASISRAQILTLLEHAQLADASEFAGPAPSGVRKPARKSSPRRN